MASFLTNNIIKLDSISSTNRYAYDLLKKGNLKGGDVVVAMHQKIGVGQVGKKWESEHGKNLLMSIILSPVIKIDKQFDISICISLALYDCVKKYINKDIRIKWPNDFFILKQKIAGISIKNIVKGKTIKNTIVGIGLNVNQTQFEDYVPKATSIKNVTNKIFKIDEIRDELLSCIQERFYYLKLKEFTEMKREYIKLLYGFNLWADYEVKSKKLRGKIIGIDNIGKLLFQSQEEKIESLGMKEICFLF